jgi:hypothetical protein
MFVREVCKPVAQRRRVLRIVHYPHGSVPGCPLSRSGMMAGSAGPSVFWRTCGIDPSLVETSG